jgi:hypothetical protein
MSDAITLPAKSKDWTRAERELFSKCQARVLGDRDYKDRVLVEILSGPLTGSRCWMKEADLTRKEGE